MDLTERFGPAAELISSILERTPLKMGDDELNVACSGGPDSTALAVVASATGRPVTLHHVDHGIRPDSGHDAGVVKELAAWLGVGFVSHQVVVTPGANVEARARAERFAVLPKGIATGHTMDDQGETVLVNLLRGTGIDGLAAMEFGPTHPFLAVRRAETHALCQQLRLSVVHDESNNDLRFTRNKIRNQLVPMLDQIADRDVVPLLARLASLAHLDSSLLNQLAEELVVDPTDVNELRGHPEPLAQRALRQWVRDQRPVDGENYPPSDAEIRRIMAVVRGEVVAAQVSGGHRVARSSGRLRFESGDSTTLTAMDSNEAPQWAAHDLGPVIVSAEDIQRRVIELGAQITADYAESPPLLVCVLKGALHFMSDLSMAIKLPIDLDFMAVSSYGSATQTSGIVRIVKDLEADLTNRHVLVVEDIIDSGLTLNYLRKYLSARGPKSIEVCALLLKEGEQRVEPDFRYVGFTIPPSFVVGYGLDVAEKYRNLDGIYTYIGEGSH